MKPTIDPLVAAWNAMCDKHEMPIPCARCLTRALEGIAGMSSMEPRPRVADVSPLWDDMAADLRGTHGAQ